jgi:hypothetical protein
MIRDRINALQSSADQAHAQVKTRSIVQTIQSLRKSLGNMMARGILTVADSTPHMPGEIATAPMDQSAAPGAPAAMPAPEMAAPPIPDATPAASMTTSTDSSLVAAATPQSATTTPADWTATSVTIVISD